MHKPSADELHRMKKIELDIMRAVHHLCTRQAIPYYLICGSMLGAVRHGGFIPWDDDIDIGIPREDYENFLEFAPKLLPKEYHVVHYRNTPGYHNAFAKVVACSTEIVEVSAQHTGVKMGVYIDVFPLDGISSHVVVRWVHQKVVAVLKILMTLYFLDNTVKRSPVKHIIIGCLQYIFTGTDLQNMLEKVTGWFPAHKNNIWINHYGYPSERMPRSHYGMPVTINFENEQFFGVACPDAYLKQVYGDYMTPPPPTERVSNHDMLVVKL